MKIALVRGPSLTPWEIQSFESLIPSDDVTLFSTTYTPQWISCPTSIRIDRCFWPDQWMAWIHPGLAWFFNGICSRSMGFSYHMWGLKAKLNGFDIIHTLETHNTFSYQALQAKQTYGGKLVVTVWETIPFRGESHPLRTYRKRQVLQGADAFIAVTERSKQMLMTEGVPESRIHVLPMGIDCSHFFPHPAPPVWRRRWEVNDDDFVILCVARWVAEKGVFDLIRAFHDFSKGSDKSDKLRLIFVGKGPEGVRMKRLIGELGLAKRIVLTEPVSYADMPDIYVSADCSVLPSVPTSFWEEQFGYALVEAMAAGLPVISTSCGAIPHVIGDAGVIVPPGNSDALTKAMARIHEDKTLRIALGRRGRDRSLQNFQGADIAQKLRRIYGSLLS